MPGVRRFAARRQCAPALWYIRRSAALNEDGRGGASAWSGNPRAFCRRVMHNIVIDQSRAAARRPRETRLFPASDSSDPRSADPHDAVELRPALFAALDTLTAQQRALVVLRYFDDRSEADVAQLLGVSTGTVKSTVSRAVAQLRSHPGLTAIFATTDSPL